MASLPGSVNSVDGAKAAPILAIAAALAAPVDELGGGRPPVQAINLTDGSAGVALLFAELTRVSERLTGLGDPERWRAAALAHINHAIAGAARIRMGPDLSAGLAGVAWAMAHVERIAGIEVEIPDEVDDLLLDLVRVRPWRGDFDLISGLVGLGVYFVERLPTRTAAQGLAEIVERLAELAVRSPIGAAWLTPAAKLDRYEREQFPAGYFDLGLAHGLAGVIAFLATALESGHAPASRDLLEAAVAWLLAHELDGGGFSWVYAEGIVQSRARLAWCYGDPGVAIALLRSGRALRRPELVDRGRALMCSAMRRSLADSRVEDAGLCHGSAGLLQMLVRASELAPSDELDAALARWVDWTLAARSDPTEDGCESVAGFIAYTYSGGRRYAVAERGLLNGAAGIGLALLATLGAGVGGWDRALLLSGVNDGE